MGEGRGRRRLRRLWLAGALPPDWEAYDRVIVHVNLTLDPAHPRHARLLRYLGGLGPRARAAALRDLALGGRLDALLPVEPAPEEEEPPDLAGLAVFMDGGEDHDGAGP
jgi:hypothetical protein